MLETFFNKIEVRGTGKQFPIFLYLILFSLAFFMTIVVGTISHELGHCIVAKYFGYDISIDYHSMKWDKSAALNFNKPKIHQIYVTIGGVGITFLLSIFALIKLRLKKTIDLYFWILLFVSLFISRQIVNLIISIYGKILFNRKSYFGGDEYELSILFELPTGFFSIVTAIISTLICGYIFFIILPEKFRLLFFFSSVIGGIGGYYLWFHILGKLLLPPI